MHTVDIGGRTLAFSEDTVTFGRSALPIDEIEGLNVIRSDTYVNGAWVNGPSVNASQTSMTVRGLKPGKRYTFQLGAKNGAGTHWSAYFYVSTAGQPTGYGEVY